MKAIVLSCDKYHPMADHMIQCYQDIWPSNNFTFRIPYQNETNYFNLKYGNKVEMIKSDRMIKPTVLKLIEDLVDDDWVYWWQKNTGTPYSFVIDISHSFLPCSF